MVESRSNNGRKGNRRKVVAKHAADEETIGSDEAGGSDPRELVLESRALMRVRKPKKHRPLYRHQAPRKFGRSR